MIRYLIPIGALKVSTNKIYAGIHWAQRKAAKDGILGYAKIFCRPAKPIQSYPVEIRYRFLFSSRTLDTLNCAFMAKMFEDALRHLGILKEDDPAHVAKSVLEVAKLGEEEGKALAAASGQQMVPKREDYLEITIQNYKQVEK